VGGALERVQIFSYLEGLKIEIHGIFSNQGNSLTQFFVESCVDFEVAHLSVLMVWRLPYPEIPTLHAFTMFCIIGNTTYEYSATITQLLLLTLSK